MIRFAANLSLLFTELPFEDRFAAARDAGFDAVEFSFPAGLPAVTVARHLERTALRQVLATVPLRPGSKGLAAVVGREVEFKDDFLRGLEYAVAGNSPLLHVLSGVVDHARHESSCRVFEENMNWAIEEASRYKIKLVIEAINQVSLAGYFIRSLSDAIQWTERLDGLGLILDIYHASMEQLDPMDCTARYLAQADHFQMAGFPGRHEPDVGRLNARAILDFLKTHAYQGWIGCEYNPVAGTADGLGWLNGYRGP
ncbi:TIM barrel protein [Pseudomonas sp. ICMP22404]|uniref:hydroxypyruvate isomerase family protein n=1 Tax=Pseudomonas sp. ICMP22404 TaxID=2583807 RepID=UPI00111923C7|nr:TIM barrel protein [Pseudomonas sp. ICMP22404]TNF83442.1 TIM barrel protein [Pseudomonas sp. ICMP22404]